MGTMMRRTNSRSIGLFIVVLSFVMFAEVTSSPSSPISPSNSVATYKRPSTLHRSASLTISNTTAPANLTLIDFFHLSNNSLRHGFEPFFYLTNLFVDNVFLPNIPKYEETLEDDDKSVKKNPTPITQVIYKGFVLSLDNMGDTLATAFKFYPSLFLFIVCVILLSILVSFVGLMVCCYRSFCRPKFNRFDKKYQSIKRKLISVVLFLFLVVNLPALVILFFTNQNALNAVGKLPDVANSSLMQIGEYLQSDVPKFFNKVSIQIDAMQSDVPDSFDSILERSLNRSFEKFAIKDLVTAYNDGLSKELQNTHEFYLDLVNLVDKLKPAGALDELNRDQIAELDDQLEAANRFINKSLSVLSIQSNNKSFSFGNFLADSNEDIKLAKRKYIESVSTFLNKTSIEVNSTQADLEALGGAIQDLNIDSLTIRTDSFKYVYYVKLGLSGLCTLLFLLFSLGLAGIFCNRKQNNYHQSCHRGIASNLLLAAVGLFFIFAITMAVSAAVLSIFGIFGRQLVCKPAIDLNQNEAFQIISKVPRVNKFIGDVDVYHLLSECKMFDHSSEFKKQIKRKLVNFVESKKPLIMDNLETELAKMGQVNVLGSLQSLRSNLDKLNSSLNEFFDSEDKKLGAILNGLNSSSSKSEKDSLDVSSFRKVAIDLAKNTRNKLNEFMEMLKSKLNTIDNNQTKDQLSYKSLLNDSIVEVFDSLVDRKIDKVFESSPPCKTISNVYISTIQTGCYEFLDNFNTFWFTLLVVFLLNIFISGFSIILADLFRKYYPYEEILATEVSNYDKETHDYKGASTEVIDDLGRLRFYNKSNRVENYEMNRYFRGGEYNRPDYNRPDYYDRRA